MVVFVYCLLFIITLAFFFQIFSIDIKKRNLYFCMIVGLLLTILSSVRDVRVGVDLAYYIPEFTHIGKISWQRAMTLGWEKGYTVYNKLLYYLSSDKYMLIACTSVIVMGGYIRYIHRYSKCPWLSFFLFITLGFYASTFNLLRQMMAMVIVMYSLRYVEERNFVKFVVGVLLAALLFHHSAVSVLLLYPLMRIKINFTNFIGLSLIIFVFFYITGKYILLLFINNIYEAYSLKQEVATGVNMMILLFIVTFMAIAFSDKKENDLHLHMMVAACALQFLSLDFSMMARVVVYFSVAMIIIIPNTIEEMQAGEDVKIWARMGVCALTLLFFLYMSRLSEAEGRFVYKFM